jgi:sorting nexin-8
MSLFGDSPTGTPPARSKQSLFDDDAPKGGGASLFADDAGSTADSPWSFPTPKKAARGNLLKSLLPSSEVPDLYIDVCDKLLAMEGSSSGVGSNTVRGLLEESGIDTDAQQSILGTVLPDENKELGRNELNVLIALIGLAQEGEELTLDGVDERRKSEYEITLS